MCINCEFYQVDKCGHDYSADGEPPCMQIDRQQKQMLDELLMEQQEQMQGEILMEKMIKQKTVTIDVVVYVASDGKEFNNVRDCEQYEKRLTTDKLKPHFDDLRMVVLEDFLHESEEIFLIEVNGESDWNILKAYFEDEYTDVNLDKMPTAFPAEVVISTTEYGCYREEWNFADVQDMFFERYSKVRDFIDL